MGPAVVAMETLERRALLSAAVLPPVRLAATLPALVIKAPPPIPPQSAPVTPKTSIPSSYPTGPGPSTVNVGPDGKLVYSYDPNGDRIPDFSECGYGGGGVTIPDVPVKVTLQPVAGDNSPQIQAAIDQV